MAFPTTAPTTLSNGKYNAFGVAVDFATSGHHAIIYREGAHDSAVGDAGIIRMIKTTDDWATQAAPVTILSESSVDLRNIAGGVTPTGRCVIFYARANPGVSFTSLSYIYSDDEGSTWSAKADVSGVTDTSYSPYGELQAWSANNLMQTYYGITSTKYSVYAIFSTDNGATWGSQVTMVTATGGIKYTETSAVALDSTNGIAMCRQDSGSVFRQLKTTDSGQTWTNQGDISFDSWATTSPSPPLLKKFTENSTTMIACYYSNRPVGDIRVTYCSQSNALSGVSSWAAGTANFWSLATGYAAGTGFMGYPMINQKSNSRLFCGAFFNDSAEADNQADLIFAILNVNVGLISPIATATFSGVSPTISRIYTNGTYTPPIGGTLAGVAVKVDGTTSAATQGTQTMYGVAYLDSAGTPGAFIGKTGNLVITHGDAAAWKRGTSSGTTLITSSSSYWVGFHHGAVSAGTTQVISFQQTSSTSSGSHTLKFQQDALNSDPDPLGTVEGTAGPPYNVGLFMSIAPTLFPVNTSGPSISGNASVGSVLTASAGTWSDSPSFTYQWTRNGTNIGGATSSTYTLVAADAFTSIGVTVTATNTAGAPTASSPTVFIGSTPDTQQKILLITDML